MSHATPSQTKEFSPAEKRRRLNGLLLINETLARYPGRLTAWDRLWFNARRPLLNTWWNLLRTLNR